jgi:hypothetical protein
MLLHEFYLWIICGQFTGIYVEKEGCTDVLKCPCQNFTAPAWFGLDLYSTLLLLYWCLFDYLRSFS